MPPTSNMVQFALVCVYVPNSGFKTLRRLDYRVKRWDVDFRKYLKQLEEKGKPVVIAGDFNGKWDVLKVQSEVTGVLSVFFGILTVFKVGHEDIDLSDPKEKCISGYTDVEKESFTKLLNDGYIDTFRHLHPTKQTYSGFNANARIRVSSRPAALT